MLFFNFWGKRNTKLPASSNQTAWLQFTDSATPATFSRTTNAWNPESGDIAPHNLLLWSNTFTSGAPWIAEGTPTTAKTETDPFGVANNASTITDNSAVAAEDYYQSATVVNGVPTIASFYVKKTTGIPSAYPAIILISPSHFSSATIDTTNGVLYEHTSRTGRTYAASTQTIVSEGNYWRVAISRNATQTSETVVVFPAFSTTLDANGDVVVAAQATHTFYGAQLNAYSLTDYVPTTTAAVYSPRYVTGKQSTGVLVEKASTNKVTAYSVPRADSLGAELLTTAQQQCDSGWTATGEAVANTGSMRLLSTGALSTLMPTTGVTIVTGQQYKMTYTVSGTPSGSMKGNDGVAALVSTVGTHTVYFTGVSSNVWLFARSAACNIIIDNITLNTVVDPVGISSYSIAGTMRQNIPNMTLSGDTAATLSIVTDQAAIDAAIALNPTDGSMVALKAARANGYKVYKLTRGAGLAYVQISGVSGNTATHLLNSVVRVDPGTGSMGDWSIPANTVTTTSTSYTALKTTPTTASASTQVYFLPPANSSIYFLASTLEESAYATSPILTSGAATTRAYDKLEQSTVGIVAAPATIQGWWKPVGTAAGVTQTLWSTWTDASNYTALQYVGGTGFVLTKRVAGTSTAVTSATTATANTWYMFDIIINADNTMNLYINGTQAGTNTTTVTGTPVIAATMQHGAFNNTLHADGVLDSYRFFNRVLTAAEVQKYYSLGR